jgi:hypothetical protein
MKPWEATNIKPDMFKPKLDGKIWLSRRSQYRKLKNSTAHNVGQTDTSAGNSTTSPRKYSVTHSNNTDSTSAVAPELNTDQVAIVTPTKRPLKRKYNIHKKPKCFSPVKENCKTCNVQIPRVLMRHHLGEHQRQPQTDHSMSTRHKNIYYCTKCAAGFSSAEKMITHMFIKHNTDDFQLDELDPNDHSKKVIEINNPGQYNKLLILDNIDEVKVET